MTTPLPAPVRELGYAVSNPGAFWSDLEQETTPELRWPLSIHVYDKMRRQDAQAASVLRAVTLPIRRTAWSIEQAGADLEVARFVAENLGLPLGGVELAPAPRTRDRFSWSEHLQQALLAIVYGHMFFEQVYRPTPDGQRYMLRKLAPRMPSTISAINVAKDGGLESIEQYATLTGGRSGSVKISASRLVAYVHEREGGNWFGQSLLRSAYKHWLLKDRALRTWSLTVERNGMGVPIYEAAGDSDFEAGKKLAEGFRSGENAGGAIPKDAKLSLKGVEGTLPDIEKKVRYHDEQIGRSVLAHFLNLNAQGGSYALASVQADTFTQSLQALAQQIADTATQHIVEDLVDVNFGPNVPAPRVAFQEIGSRSAVTAEALRLLIDAGVLDPNDPALRRFTRATFGIPGDGGDGDPTPGGN